MLIAQEKRKTNIVEYILYMYQIEDIIRAMRFDINSIESLVISKFDYSNTIKENVKIWYQELIDKMRSQNIQESGHLEELNILAEDLSDLHRQLLTTLQNRNYIKSYEKAKHLLKDLVLKSGGQELSNEIDVALNGLYGLLILKLKGESIKQETESAFKSVSHFMGLLVNYYQLKEEGKLKLPRDRSN